LIAKDDKKGLCGDLREAKRVWLMTKRLEGGELVMTSRTFLLLLSHYIASSFSNVRRVG
jgi:hypothetical protein